jgi:hypothetical protein
MTIDQIVLIVGLVGTILTGIAGFIKTLRGVRKVHVLVNSQLTTTLNRVEQLASALRDANVKVPSVMHPVPADATGAAVPKPFDNTPEQIAKDLIMVAGQLKDLPALVEKLHSMIP